jgi:Flagellar assembly protein T, middle domain/Flagellar assembly protein T, N-terminal domain
VLSHNKSIFKYIILVLFLTSSICFAKAEATHSDEVYVVGVAAIVRGDRDSARQRALVDALNQASLSMGTHVLSTEKMNIGKVPLQSMKIRPTHQVSKYSILREWEAQDMYHVVIRAEGDGKGSAVDAISSIRPVKKKVVFTQFDVDNTIHVDDISNIFDGLPSELSWRLEAGGDFLASFTSDYIPRESGALQQKIIMEIAKKAGAQFLISGNVIDAKSIQNDGYLGTAYGKYNRRNFQIEFAVYDGLTGVQLLSNRLADEMQGEVLIGNDKPFGSIGFYETEYGRVIDRVMGSVIKKISTVLDCLPFSTNVVRIEGKILYLDAGETSMLKVGDKLAVYSNEFHSPIIGVAGAVLGTPERPVTTVTLIKIQPRFSIGELQEDAIKLGVKTSGIARFEFADKRRSTAGCLQ